MDFKRDRYKWRKRVSRFEDAIISTDHIESWIGLAVFILVILLSSF